MSRIVWASARHHNLFTDPRWPPPRSVELVGVCGPVDDAACRRRMCWQLGIGVRKGGEEGSCVREPVIVVVDCTL